MKNLTTDEIRSSFLKYFQERGHEVVPSSPLVPANDPTLLFTNAGMVQFKDVFTEKEKRGYTTATSSQKCVRAGGKHNDLENVGYTTRHHTFFEMLGNFSFGDYFKEKAIEYAWSFLIDVLELPKDRLCVTIFEGDKDIPADEEAAEFWKQQGVPSERIIRLGRKDNYWQMGETGPQGPSSEIHYFWADDVENMFAPGRVAESEGWIEIWNLVFMQFVKETADSPIQSLPKPCVDTGAGLERLAMILQGKLSNYETDGIRPYLNSIAEEIGKPYNGADTPDEVSMRVIADHARATTFLVADGVQPSNLGRGYVLRRIMRRAIRHGSRLGYDDLFFHRACARVVEKMKDAYPQLIEASTLIEKVAMSEETAFRRTLENGLKLLNKELEDASDKAIDPSFVAKLYGTFGFPIDLTRVIATERGFTVDEIAAMEIVKSDSGANENLGGTDDAVKDVWFRVREEVGPSQFLGYEMDAATARIVAVEELDDDFIYLVLDQTPFYGEAGGQVGDTGTFRGPALEVSIVDTQKPRPDLIVHKAKVIKGEATVGLQVEAEVDSLRRQAVRRSHSATHLVHLALKEVLGAHVQQKGSLVAPDRLRFDYSHFEALTSEEITKIEHRVNELVLLNAPTETDVCKLEQARSAGATMLFGEKYGDVVRMVRVGSDSLELCGGTHVQRAGEIGLIKTIGDSAVAAGVRRIEAVAGLAAVGWAHEQAEILERVSGLMKSTTDQLVDRLEKVLKQNKTLERELEKARAKAAMAGQSGGDLLDNVEEIAGFRVLVHRADGTPKKALRDVSDQLRDRLGSGIVVLGACEAEKASLLVAVTKDLGSQVDAGKIVKRASEAMEGRGGGRKDFAQGGGKSALLGSGFDAARRVISEMKS